MKPTSLAVVLSGILFGSLANASAVTSESNVIHNPGFEDKGLGWSYWFANIRSDGAYEGTYRGRIAIGAEHHISQVITVPETGYYDLSAFIQNDKQGGQFGLKNLAGEILLSKQVGANRQYSLNKIKHIALEEGEVLSVFFSGSNKTAVSIDNVTLAKSKKDKLPTFNQIIQFNVAEQSGSTTINRNEQRIEFSVPYGTDVTQLTISNLLASPQSQTSLRQGDITDFSNPIAVDVINEKGKAETWTVSGQISEKEVTISSSNAELEDAFNWAIDKTKQFVMTGQSGLVNRDERNNDGSGTADYIPSYWAGYFDRTAFYSRDFLHQASGGWLAGLGAENLSMFQTFARHSTEPRKWYTLWAINFDGTPHTIDYHHDDYFVREVPAQFEFVEKAFEQYRWTGDERYINDPDLWQFYTKVLTDYIALHDDQEPNGIAEGYGGIFEGSATYNERGEFPIEAGDGIGSQYQATVAYAAMLEARGEMALAAEWGEKATELKRFFNEEWSIKDPANPLDNYVNIIQKDGLRLNDFGKENSWFMPMKLITEPGERNDNYLSFISENLGEGIGSTPEAPHNIEAYTYIPETYFPYNQNEEAWKWMNYIINKKDQPHERPTQGTNGDYPEISFTFISNTIEGLMGIEPNAPENRVVTASHLPQDIEWLEVDYLPMGEHELAIRHNGLTETSLNNASDEALEWEARFYGKHDSITVNGTTMKAKNKKVNGVTLSYVVVGVPANGEVIASIQ